MDRQEILRQLAEVGELPPPAEVQFRGKTFHVARINGAMRDAMGTFRQHLQKRGIDRFGEAHLAAMGLCAPDGTAVFEDLAEGAAMLGRWDGELQEALAQKFIEINALSEEASGKKSDPIQN